MHIKLVFGCCCFWSPFFSFLFFSFFSFLAFVYLCVLKRTHVCVLCMCVCYALQLSVE